MKLHRDIGVSQKTAWFMLQRIRKAWERNDWPFGGPVEVDETYVGGSERNKREFNKLRWQRAVRKNRQEPEPRTGKPAK